MIIIKDILDTIYNRRSVRHFSNTPISREKLDCILKAGISGPTGKNSRPWVFTVVEGKDELSALADSALRYENAIRHCTLAVVICADERKKFNGDTGNYILDCAISAENMILAAESLGIGSCYLSVWPAEDKISSVSSFLNLPNHVIAHTILAFGYPSDDSKFGIPRFSHELDSVEIHYGPW